MLQNQQEIRFFLRTSIDCCRDFPSLCLKVLHSIKVAIESRFLDLFFNKVDFVHLLQTILSNIDQAENCMSIEQMLSTSLHFYI